jgi:DNA mismatch repair protein MutS
LVNGERFITEELKEQEEIILKAEDVLKIREYELYKELLEEVVKYASYIQDAAHAVAKVDCIESMSKCAKEHRYIRPKIVYSHELIIRDGRHPVVEQLISQTQFVPNNTKIGNPDQSLILLTGPNMAGKSVYLRQVAMITLLAHIGSFVPAKSAYIPIVDSIFVRSGASDMISSGLSTFMVEMVETAFILNHATSKSLIVMDEIGRGTSTYDGVSIAWAVAEYFMEHFTPAPKTLFATHYHELIDLEKKYPKKLRNAHMDVSHNKNEPVFTHALIDGPAYESYGVEVAKLAGVPQSVVIRADALLSELHTNQATMKRNENVDLKFKDEISHIDVNNTTPLQALALLSKLKLKYE